VTAKVRVQRDITYRSVGGENLKLDAYVPDGRLAALAATLGEGPKTGATTSGSSRRSSSRRSTSCGNTSATSSRRFGRVSRAGVGATATTWRRR
jgi:hypothetical protein